VNNNLRIGIGYDIHGLMVGRKMILGGVEIPHDKGLRGWSDADVLTHAIIDALLGAAALGDIGSHFPSGESQFKNISSLILLAKVRDKLHEHGWQISNLDSTIIAEKPKLAPYINSMKQQISEILEIINNKISIKATTSDRLGFTGRGEAVAAVAIAMVGSIVI
jgi:2-C-methyl-D-erythritol 2,4-cyclodiphosphate synthase